jgi:hypothetical protein
VPVASSFMNSLSIIREKAATRNIRLTMDAVEELGSIQADARKVKQIVYNLLSNAVKFTPDGGQVTLRAGRVPRAEVARLEHRWTASTVVFTVCCGFAAMLLPALLLGPQASGKTHLARVWQALSGAQALVPETLMMSFLDGLDEATPLVVEDADRIAYDEKALFHLLNLAREKRLYVLITAESAPSRWGLALPDLKSRLNAVPAVEIGAPDEALIRTVLLKHFADRQLDIDPKVLTYLALHVDRSLAAAAAAVAAVDRAALASGRKISRQLVIEALAASGLPEDEAGRGQDERQHRVRQLVRGERGEPRVNRGEELAGRVMTVLPDALVPGRAGIPGFRPGQLPDDPVGRLDPPLCAGVAAGVLLEQLECLGELPLRRDLAPVPGNPRLAAVVSQRVDPVRLRLGGVMLPELRVGVRGAG